MADEATTSVGRSLKNIIYSGINIPTYNNTSLMANATPAWNFWAGKNYVHVDISMLAFRLNTVVGGTDVVNEMDCINMKNVTQFTYDYLRVDTSSVLHDAAMPTAGTGIITPGVSNKIQIGEGSCFVSGFFNGLLIGEHYNGYRAILLGCVNGIRLRDGEGYHSCSLVHLNSESCKNIINMADSDLVLNIFNYDVEHHTTSPSWHNFVCDITRGTSVGKINIFNSRITRSFTGNVDDFVVVNTPSYKVVTGHGAN